jgi:hypothetical protein
MSLTTLASFYDLHLTESWKNKMIDCLSESIEKNNHDGGSFITEVPSLIFSLQALSTDRNINDLRSLVEGLSHIYLSVIGERIDINSASHLMFAWTETGTYNEDICNTLIDLCI